MSVIDLSMRLPVLCVEEYKIEELPQEFIAQPRKWR